MKDIFSELYNKVLGFFRQTEKKEEETAKDVACNRLKFVLMQDRTNLTPELMDRMRNELIDLLSKYVEMDKEALELGFEQEGTQMALMLSIPVVRAKDEAEIEAILAKEDEEKAKLEAVDEIEAEPDSVVTEEKTDGADTVDSGAEKENSNESNTDELTETIDEDITTEEDSTEEKVVVVAAATSSSAKLDK